MKKNIKRTLIIISMLLVVCITLGLCQNYLFVLDDHNAWRIRGFYLEEKDSLDVVFMGASDVFTGYSPGLAYRDYGITSYAFASNASSIISWKYQLNEILSHQSPQAIVIEINGALYSDDSRTFDDGTLRLLFDNTPLSMNKIYALSQLKLTEDRLSYLFPLIKYHSNISDAKKSLRESRYYQSQGFAALRGFMTFTETIKCENVSLDPEKSLPLSDASYDYLIDFLSYCKNNSINNIIFTRFPHIISNEERKERAYRLKTAVEIITSYGYTFVDLESNSDMIEIDYNSDFYGEDHLNVFGAEKNTDFWGKYLTEDCRVKPHQLSDKQKEEWNYTVEYTDRFFAKAKERINNNTGGAMTERSTLYKQLFD